MIQLFLIKQEHLLKGEFEVVEISDDHLLEIGAYGEYMSNHPIARSIVKAYNKEIDSTRIEDFKEIAGKGLFCCYWSKTIWIRKWKNIFMN